MIQAKNMQKLKLNLKTTTFISLFCLLSILSFGQNTKNIAPELNAANSKTTGMRINHNANAREIGNAAKPVQKQLVQVGIGNNDEETYEKDAVFAERNPKDEVLERRDRTSKHYRNADGTFEAILSTGSINYFEKGQWLTIERAILPNNSREYPEYEYANTKNSFKTYLSNNQSKGIKTVVEDQEITEWQNKRIEFYDADMNLISSIQSENSEISINHAKASYANVFPHTEAQITQLHDGRKIDYEISTPDFLNFIPVNSKYIAVSEDIVLPIGWKAKYYIDKLSVSKSESNQQISIFNEKGEEILRYMPPAYFEKANQHDIENPVGEYQILQSGQTLTIKTITEADWFRNENRTFPVVIDPTVNVYPNNTTNWTRSADGNGNNYTNLRFGLLVSGYWAVTGMKFNTASIVSGSIVSAVRGYFYITEAYQDWGGGVQFAYSSDPTTNSGINLYNGVTGALSNPLAMASPNSAWKSIALNSTGISHVQSNIASSVNLGLDPTSGYFYYGQYYAAVNHTNDNRPYLSVNYTTPSGPPSCTTPISPLNAATGTAHSGNIEWNAVPGANTYDVYFGTASTPPLVSSNQTGTTYNIGSCLLPETTYYWKVVPKNGDGSATGCATWSFTTDNKLHIYKNDWETASEGYFGTSGTSVDGWYANSITGNTSGYKNVWTVGTGTYAINGKSVGVTAMRYEALASSHFMYWEDLGTIYRWIYRPFDMTEMRDIEVAFDWKCGGELNNDFGTVATSINNGANWITDDQGGLYNNGKYSGSPSTIQSESITLPETRNNQSDFQLAFKWNDLGLNNTSSYPSFVVDNIVIKACPYEGYLSSPDQTEPFAWSPPTANTTTTITVNETHNCAYFEWEQSTDNGNTWTVIPGETSVSYTTPSNLTSNTFYRCRVYFSTGCPGAYQGEAFKIVFSPDCTTPIAPTDGSSIQSTSFRLSWNPDPLATSYDVYFGTDNPPATMIGNTANQFYDVDNMDYNTTYYWQILPTNAGGSASGCDVWSFTTGSAPPQFHNYGGTEQLTFDNSAYKVDNPNFRISHGSTMEEVQIQISQDVTFPGTTVFDGNFAGSFNGENNFETSLSGQVLNESYFPQAFNTDVLTHGYTAGNNTWFAPESKPPIAWIDTGGNPGGRVGYSGSWNEYWGNFLRLPEVNCTGQDLVTLTFDVWHSYFAAQPNDKLYLSAWADGGYINLPQTVKIDGVSVTASANIGSSGYAFYFTEERDASKIEVTLDISGITDKSSILLYLNPSCGYNNSNEFYVYFDNISITGATQEFTPGTTYYARARGKIGGNWTAWTSEIHSFTYKNQADTEWYQTAEPQFLTNTLSDVITVTEFGSDFATIPASGGTPSNPFNDPSFETGSGWSTSQSYSVYETYLTSNDNGTNGITHGSQCAKFAEDDYSWQSFFNGEYNNASQQVDLTGVTDIVFDVTHWRNTQSNMYSCGTGRACKVVWSFKVIIGDAGTSGDNSGTEVYSWTPTTPEFGTTNNNDVSVDISSYGFTGTKTVKFSRVVTNGGGVWYDDDKYYLDNIRGEYNATQTGTITSTPINLSSFYGYDSWNELSWDQTLNGGSISMSIEEDNGGTWTPLTGFTNLSVTGDGIKTVDISSLSSISRIRVIAEFSETGAKGSQPELNNWIVKTKKDEILPVSLLYFDIKCNENIKILNWSTASETNNDYFIIQKSNDAKNFTDIAQVTGAGNSNRVNNYSFYDEQSSVNEVYYRLKQIDFDGTSETFEIIHADCNENTNSEITAYPNPFDGKILYLNSTRTLKNAVINIYDALGRLVYQTNCAEINSHTELKINSQLEPGAYYLEISSKNEVNKRISLIVK